jgi:4-amino-4-deoxy-L-arabinose transferase-like glycosyltransferase
MRSAGPSGPLARAALALGVFLAALACLCSRIEVSAERDSPPFYPDEASKLADARYGFLLFEPGGTRDPAWHERFYARTNPPLGRYAFGAAFALAGERIDDLSLEDRFNLGWREPDELRRHVPDTWLRIGRRTSAFFAALACAALALLAASVAGLAAGAASALLLLGNAQFDLFARLALTDSLLLFLLCFAALAFVPGLRAVAEAGSGRPRGSRASIGVRAAVVPGVCIALATGTKPNGALLGPAWALALLGVAVGSGSRRSLAKRLVGASVLGAATALVAFAIFVAANPYLYERPLAKLAESTLVWRDWMVKQQLDPGGAIYEPAQRLAQLVHSTLRARETPLVRAFGGAGRWLGLALFAIGVGGLARRAWAGARGAPEASGLPALAAVGWAISLLVGLVLWLPLARSPYVFPAYLAVCLAQGVAAADLARGLGHAIGALRGARRPVVPGPDAAPAALAIAVAVALAPGSPLVDPSLLHPLLVPDAFPRKALGGYRRAVEARPDSPIRRYHLGVALGRFHRHAEGAREFAVALQHLPPPPSDAATEVLRADLLQGLARYREASGALDAAAAAWDEYRVVVEGLRAAMRSTDPFVRASFDLVLATHGPQRPAR